MLNKIVIMGRLTADPELRYTQSNVPVASFTVAVDRDYADRDGNRATDFVSCVAWRQGGEFVSKYFSRGSMIVCEGRLESRQWTDRDGNKRTSWEINCDRTYFGEARRREEQGGQTWQPAGRPVAVDPEPEYERPRVVDTNEPTPFGTNADPRYAPAPQATVLDEDDGDLPF